MDDIKNEDSDVQTKTGVWPLIKSITGEGGPQEDFEEEPAQKEGGSGSSEEGSGKQD